MNDNIEKNLNLENLEDLELEQVNGGDGIMPVPPEGYEEDRYCKYCKSTTRQVFIGTGWGYDSYGMGCNCALWKCKKCNNTNYWNLRTGELI